MCIRDRNMNSLFEKLISMISLPWRFLSIATVMLAVCGIIALINDVYKRQRFVQHGVSSLG